MSFDEEDDLVSMFETGMSVMDESAELKRLRLILDTISPVAGYRKLAAIHADVAAWLKKVDNKRASLEYRLTGVKRSWLKKQLKKFKDNCDNVSPMGEPLEGVKDPALATDYSPYAVEAHRTLFNQKAYGVLPEPDGERMTFADDHDFDDTPRWWSSNIYIGKFCRTDFCKKWVSDIRWGDTIGGRFTHISKLMPAWMIDEYPAVKEFKRRWYNDPKSLTIREIGYGKYKRWACGMIVKDGKWLWAPMTHKSSQYFDWRIKRGDMEFKRKRIEALEKGDNVVTYQKRRDHMLVTWKKADDQTGLWAIWAQVKMSYMDARLDYKKRLKAHWTQIQI